MAFPRAPKLDIHVLLENGFNEETARSLYAQGEEVVIFVLMQLVAFARRHEEGLQIQGQERRLGDVFEAVETNIARRDASAWTAWLASVVGVRRIA